MFTAKTLVGDKVAGFQAGADDYLTKPIHPAELASRVEAVLLRSARTRTEAGGKPHARIIGCIGVKGGVGTTTLAINVAVAIAQAQKDGVSHSVALADLHAGAGDIALQLGINRPGGLPSLLSRQADEITAKTLEPALVGHVSGVRMLLTPVEQRVGITDIPAKHADTIVRQLANLADVVVLDLGSRIDDGAYGALKLCSRVVIALEPQRTAVMLAQAMITQVEKAGVGPEKIVATLINRSPSASTLSKGTIEGLLNRDIAVAIPPGPEVAFQASEQGAPIIMVQPGNIVSDQFRELARFLMLGPVS
jgi:pilus assembly protein CpaE